jgi:hypothetical protein
MFATSNLGSGGPGNAGSAPPGPSPHGPPDPNPPPPKTRGQATRCDYCHMGHRVCDMRAGDVYGCTPCQIRVKTLDPSHVCTKNGQRFPIRPDDAPSRIRPPRRVMCETCASFSTRVRPCDVDPTLGIGCTYCWRWNKECRHHGVRLRRRPGPSQLDYSSIRHNCDRCTSRRLYTCDW